MTRLFAILSDIHGNYQALLRVEKDARQAARAIKADELRFICLGDVVDYGPQPNECMDWVNERAHVTVQGNHDREVARPSHEPPLSLNRNWWPVTLWTRRELEDHHKQRINTWQPETLRSQELNGFALFHSSLTSTDGYIKSLRAAKDNLRWLRNEGLACGLFGHTHFQGYFIETNDDSGMRMVMTINGRSSPADGRRLHTTPVGEWKRIPPPHEGILLNPGSVGQPRRHTALVVAGIPHDNDAAYMLLRVNGRGIEYQFRRVQYDYQETVRLLRERVRWLPTNPTEGDDGRASIDWQRRPPGQNSPGASHEDDEQPASSPMTLDLQKLEHKLPGLLSKLVESDLIPKLLPDPDENPDVTPQ